MAVKRLNLGANPRVEITGCGGNLEVRGTSREELSIEAHSEDIQIAEQEGGVVIHCPDSSCFVRMPEGGQLVIGQVDGAVRIKDLGGPVEIGRIEGQCSVRRVSSLVASAVQGEMRVYDIRGPLTIGVVEGHLTLRDIEGPITAEAVEGHFYGSNVPAGIHLGRLEGNLALRTDFNPGSSYQFLVDGHATFSVPQDANVRFTIKAEGRVRADHGMDITTEGRHRMVTIGSGESSIDVTTDGHVSIKYWDYYTGDEEAPFAFDDFSSHIEDIFTQMDSHFRDFEPSLSNLPDHVRGRVTRKLDNARRKVEEAQRRVEKAVRSAERDVDKVATGSKVQVGFARGAEPVSEEERLLILKMLEEGKISVGEAEKLLAALEGRS